MRLVALDTPSPHVLPYRGAAAARPSPSLRERGRGEGVAFNNRRRATHMCDDQVATALTPAIQAVRRRAPRGHDLGAEGDHAEDGDAHGDDRDDDPVLGQRLTPLAAQLLVEQRSEQRPEQQDVIYETSYSHFTGKYRHLRRSSDGGSVQPQPLQLLVGDAEVVSQLVEDGAAYLLDQLGVV